MFDLIIAGAVGGAVGGGITAWQGAGLPVSTS